MRLYRLAMCLAVMGLTMGLGYSTSQALPGACAVGVNVHPGARIVLAHHTIAQCNSGGLDHRLDGARLPSKRMLD